MSSNEMQTRESVNPLALSLPDMARLLSAAGERAITTAMLEADVAAGAPIHGDGTINMVSYAAWLAREDTGIGD